MNSAIKHILTFTLRNELFAIDALVVKEIVYLPELTSEEEVPAFIAGAFNLRGKIVHVMDLNLCFGHEQGRYQVTDRVIIIEVSSSESGVQSEENPPVSPFSKGGTQEIPPLAKGGEGGFTNDIRTTNDERRLLGIIVNDVLDVVSISETEIEQLSAVSYQPSAHLIAGEAKVGEEIVMVLDHKVIGSEGNPPVSPFSKGGHPEVPPLAKRGEGGFVEVSPAEKIIFHERALNLMKEAVEEVEGLVPLAVFGLDGEYYGANLEAIREFSDIRSVTPVPCTPAHIVGDMNLRGDILTLVDIRGLLNIPLKKETAGQKAIVARVNELLAGIPVNEVFEVIYLKPSDIRPVPAAVEAVGSEFMKGEAPYGGKMLTILDLHRILTRDELVVNE